MGLVLLVVVGLVFCISWGVSRVVQRESEGDDTATVQLPQVQPKATKISSKVLFTGNSFWGRYTNDAAKKTDDPYAFPFARLGEFDKSQYQAWVTGLECPTSQKGVDMTSAQMEATLSFNCDPAYLGEFAKWFDIVSLANNHTDNMGEDGFLETRQSLEQHNIQHVGHYNAEELDDVCEVVSLPVKVDYDDGNKRDGRLPIAICAHHFVFGLPSQASIEQIAKYAEVMPIVSMPHGGAEYKNAPDDIKTQLFRQMIDLGADMVIGDHAHWVQTTEAYKDRLIVYSMGNFMFDQQFNQEVTRSAAIDLELLIDNTQSEQLDKWLELGDQCGSFKDNCLEQATQLGLDRLKPSYQFKVIATSNRGYQAYPAPDLQQAVEDRLRWPQTLQALGQ